MRDEITAYLELVKKAPEIFDNADAAIRIVLDEDEIRAWQSAHPDTKIGVVATSRFNLFVRDLVVDGRGNRFAYERVCSPDGSMRRGSVCVARVKSDAAWRYVLSVQYRHAPRGLRLEFPRGFSEPGEEANSTAMRELSEETGLVAEKCEVVGQVEPDTGLVAGYASVCVVDAAGNLAQSCPDAKESIERYRVVSADELLQLVSAGEIVDGFTLAAIALLAAKGML